MSDITEYITVAREFFISKSKENIDELTLDNIGNVLKSLSSEGYVHILNIDNTLNALIITEEQTYKNDIYGRCLSHFPKPNMYLNNIHELLTKILFHKQQIILDHSKIKKNKNKEIEKKFLENVKELDDLMLYQIINNYIHIINSGIAFCNECLLLLKKL